MPVSAELCRVGCHSPHSYLQDGKVGLHSQLCLLVVVGVGVVAVLEQPALQHLDGVLWQVPAPPLGVAAVVSIARRGRPSGAG